MTFDEAVHPDHFSTLRRTPFPHALIEQQLMQMGGGGVAGSAFRKQVLQAAGWPHDGLVPFAKHPQLASTAFNRIRLALSEHRQPDKLLAALAG
ncbi:hypothetical protein ACFSQE_02175 [Vogesella fluminis]|uniref:Uncharacterized protein n=1 Tax=Vogesella fluminis TaxID=1069161 RepID=A0ABQ3H6Q5_9NEIS|nr:hypothetical protein [Vogesella fluminis]GHD70455.1 hypothetical protein GCM10011419_00740 [Vogesella fluminis]